MGSKDGIKKMRAYIIEQRGLQWYLDHQREIASKGGRSRKKPNGLDKLTHEERVANGKKYGRKKVDIVK